MPTVVKDQSKRTNEVLQPLKMNSAKVVQRKKQDLPAVGPRSMETEQSTSKSKSKTLDLNNVLRLLEGHLTANLKERHMLVLWKLLKRNQIGFLLKDLSGIAKILNICADKGKDQPDYWQILLEAVKICRLPFLKERTSDELNYAQEGIDFISNLGCLMRVPEAEIRQQILESVISLYSSVDEQIRDGLQQTSPGYRLQLLELSDMAQSLVLSMSTLEDQPSVRLQLLKTLKVLSGFSDRNCSLMLNARGAEVICLHMNEDDPTGQVLLSSAEILWNLLERGCKDKVTTQLSSMECVISLKEAFFFQLLNSSHPSDLQLRNDLLVITTLIAEHPNSRLVESFFAKELMPFITFPELKTLDPLVQNLKLRFNHEDLKMKKMMLNLLVLMSKDLAALQIYKEGRVILALLTLAEPPKSTTELRSTSRHWSSVQQEDLQLQALATLTTIAPLMLDDYMSYQGNARLLLLLDWCTGKDVFFGQGHSFHGSGGKGSKKSQMRHCIRVLRSVTSVGEETVNQDLCDQGSIGQLLGILMQMESSTDDDDAATLEMKSDLLLTLSALCENDMHRKELFGSEGVDMTLHFLKRGCDKFYSGLGHNKLVLSTVDCVWSCIVGCYTTEDFFLAREGVFLLLQLLVSSPRCVHCTVLATLLELCDNPNTPPQILSWSDDTGVTAPGLLLHLWRQEEEELGVQRSKQGALTDVQKPLLTQYQEDTQLSYPADMPSAAVLDVSENLRSKIYSIFCKIGFQDLPGLKTKDYVTLSIVRRYLDFKVGEVWQEISRELVLDEVQPISPDEEALSNICRTAEDNARKVMEEQRSMLERQEQEKVGEEKHMYTEMKTHWRQQELTAKTWDSYQAKTSNYEALKKVKAQRRKNVELFRHRPGDEDLRPEQHFLGHIVAVEKGLDGGSGPAGVRVTVARTSMKGAGKDQDQGQGQGQGQGQDPLTPEPQIIPEMNA
uniref:Cilia- and flagella-associated protein 69 ARM repeats domain-containing protein n=1 Tax=Cynoglossus semilaevis TaxID=244447 RepID=A0A3P8VHQ8_CYNSE